MSKFIVAADLHLQPCTWAKYPTLSGDSYYALSQIVDIAIQRKCEMVMLAGDFFNTKRPDPTSVFVAMHESERAAKAGVKMVGVLGQHDGWHDDISWMEVLPYVEHAHKKVVEIGGLKVYGLDYMLLSQFEKELAGVQGINAVLTHQKLFSYGERDGSFSVDWLPEGVDLVASGDWHPYHPVDGKLEAVDADRKFHKKFRSKVKPLVIYPGNTYLWRQSEPDDKFVLLFDTDDGLLTYEMVPLSTRKCLRLKIENEAAIDQSISLIETMKSRSCPKGMPEAVKKPLAIITYDPSVPDVKVKLYASLGDTVHLLFKPTSSEGVELPQEGKVESEVSDADLLATIVNREKEADLFNYLVALLEGDPREVIAAERERRRIEPDAG